MYVWISTHLVYRAFDPDVLQSVGLRKGTVIGRLDKGAAGVAPVQEAVQEKQENQAEEWSLSLSSRRYQETEKKNNGIRVHARQQDKPYPPALPSSTMYHPLSFATAASSSEKTISSTITGVMTSLSSTRASQCEPAEPRPPAVSSGTSDSESHPKCRRPEATTAGVVSETGRKVALES